MNKSKHHTSCEGEEAIAALTAFRPETLNPPEPNTTGLFSWQQDGHSFFAVVEFKDGKVTQAHIEKLDKAADEEEHEAFLLAARLASIGSPDEIPPIVKETMEKLVASGMEVQLIKIPIGKMMAGEECQCPKCKAERAQAHRNRTSGEEDIGLRS